METELVKAGSDMATALATARIDLVRALIEALITGIVGVTAGAALAVFWNLRQKKRELDLSAVESFHQLYGEFFLTWKLWNYYVRDTGPEALPQINRWELLNRISTAEGGVEAILGKVASQRNLTEDAIKALCRFRQAYQSLREAIRQNVALDWDDQSDPRYIAFKRLASHLAALIHSRSSKPSVRAKKRAKSWVDITSKKFEAAWWKLPAA